MLAIATTTDKIRVVLAGSVTTNQLHCYASYTSRNINASTYSRNFTDTNNTTAVTLVDSPVQSNIQNIVDYLSIYNSDTASATVTVSFYDGSTDHELFKAALSTGEKIEYVEGQGFRVFTNAGSIKTSLNQGNAPASSTLSVVTLGSDITNDNAVDSTFEDITGLSFAVNSGSVYYFKFVVLSTIDNAASQATFSINGPTFSRLSYSQILSSVANPSQQFTNVNYDLPAVAGTGTLGSNATAIIEGIIKPSANGTVIARFASQDSNGGDNLTAKIGSFVQYQQVA